MVGVARLAAFGLATAVVIATAAASTGVDVSNSLTVHDWKCLKSSHDVSFGIVRVGRSTGSTDPLAATTISNAKAAGISRVDGYIFPCFDCGQAAEQVKAAAKLLASVSSAGILWYDIEPFKWSSDHDKNRDFIKEMIDTGVSLGLHAGVYSNWNSWSEIVGSDWDYAQQKGLPIWYPHYDGVRSFSDFKSFGGWGAPSIKQYAGDKTVCGVDVDINFAPGAEALPQEHHQARLQVNKYTEAAMRALLNSTQNHEALSAGNKSSNCAFGTFKQCDSRWGNNKLGTSTNTICRAGCAMSCVSMILAGRGASVNPGTLNQWLTSNGGYASKDLIIWSAVDSHFGVSYQGQIKPDSSTLQSKLKSCAGLIANVRGGSHWVLLTGYQGSDIFSVHDPGFNQATYSLKDMSRVAVYE